MGNKSMSMQGPKTTVPNYVNPNINLNFMRHNPSPQSNRTMIPNINANLNMGMNMHLGMNIGMNPQRGFYNTQTNLNQNQTQQNTQNNMNMNQNAQMNKRHNQNPYKAVNSDKNVLGGNNNAQMKPKEPFYTNNQQGNQMQMLQQAKNQFKPYNNAPNNQNINNQVQPAQNQQPVIMNNANNSSQQRMLQNRTEEWNNNYQANSTLLMQNQMQSMNLKQQMPNHLVYQTMTDTHNQQQQMQMEQQRNNNKPLSICVRLRLSKDKEEIVEIKRNEDPIVISKILKANNLKVNEQLHELIYHKIIAAINISKSVLESKISKYNMKQLIQLQNAFGASVDDEHEEEKEIMRSDSCDNLVNKYNTLINDIKPGYEEVKEVELLNISQY